MSCNSNYNYNNNNNGGGNSSSNQTQRRNNSGNNDRRPQQLPIPPELQSSVRLDEYPSPIAAALAIANGTPAARTRTDGGDNGDDEEAANRRNGQEAPPDPRPPQ
ncbi:unnamed protein product [Cylindrotheca closterium]|uniref:Uncharacterized protein n=1 Tax=Cylindrotheca closterium TaxID=2856 RepID=A0AAD2G5G9_9STRA|nr:unnamed protein product [Cylindrotheca closterium]